MITFNGRGIVLCIDGFDKKYVLTYGQQKGAYAWTNGGPESDKDSTPFQVHLCLDINRVFGGTREPRICPLVCGAEGS